MERPEAEAILDGDRERAVALLLRVGELIEANRRLEARVAELERRLKRSSRSSSLPPLPDPPSAPPRPQRRGSGRGHGGQPGHEGRSRRLLPRDETGWRTAGERRTLWGALTARTAVFRIAAGRHQCEVKALLGEDFAGVTRSDRWRAYDYLDPKRRQLCWAHLVRDVTAHGEGLAAQKQFGEAGLTIAARLFAT